MEQGNAKLIGLRPRDMPTLLLVMLLMGLMPVMAAAQGTSVDARTPLAMTSPPIFDDTRRLSEFSAQSGPIRLRSSADEIDLFLPLAGTVEVVEATVVLDVVHSVALLSDRSVLSVRFNERVIEQFPLDPSQPNRILEFDIPADSWTAGFNKMSIGVVQHYADRCENPEAPELWTELNTFESRIDIQYQYRDDPYQIADLAQLVSPGFGGFGTVQFLTTAQTSAPVVEHALPLVAQALALRRDYLPLSIDVGPIEAPDNPRSGSQLASPAGGPVGLQVLVGTATELETFLTEQDTASITGPTLLLTGTRGAARLVVAGQTPEEVVQAAQGLTIIDDDLNPNAAVSFLDMDQGALSSLVRNDLVPEAVYSFEDLGVSTVTITEETGGQVGVDLPLPSNFYTYEGAEGELLLNFGYSAGMALGSTFGVSINDEFIHGLELDENDGTSFRNYRIPVPGRLLRPGNNRLMLEFGIRSKNGGGECLALRGASVKAQVIGDSQFLMPPGGTAMTLPDLSLVSRSGFPFRASSSNDRDIDVHAIRPELRGAALTLIGKIAQTAGIAEPGVRLLDGLPADTTNDVFLVASQREIPREIFGMWSVSIGEDSALPYFPVQSRQTDASQSQRSGLDTVLQLAFGSESDTANEQDTVRPTLRQTSSLGDLGVLAAFRNPWSEQFRTIVLLTAANDDVLAARLADLVSPSIWSRIEGDFATWDGSEDLVTRVVSQQEVVAPDDYWLRVRMILSRYPYIWLAFFVPVLLLLVISTTVVLRKRIKKLAQSE